MRFSSQARAVLLLATACGGEREAPPAPPAEPTIAVQTAVVAEHPMPRWLPLTGSLRAERESSVAANASGRVTAILVDPLATNERGHRFYERLGFREVERRRFGDDDCLVFRLDRPTRGGAAA